MGDSRVIAKPVSAIVLAAGEGRRMAPQQAEGSLAGRPVPSWPCGLAEKVSCAGWWRPHWHRRSMRLWLCLDTAQQSWSRSCRAIPASAASTIRITPQVKVRRSRQGSTRSHRSTMHIRGAGDRSIRGAGGGISAGRPAVDQSRRPSRRVVAGVSQQSERARAAKLPRNSRHIRCSSRERCSRSCYRLRAIREGGSC